MIRKPTIRTMNMNMNLPILGSQYYGMLIRKLPMHQKLNSNMKGRIFLEGADPDD